MAVDKKLPKAHRHLPFGWIRRELLAPLLQISTSFKNLRQTERPPFVGGMQGLVETRSGLE